MDAFSVFGIFGSLIALIWILLRHYSGLNSTNDVLLREAKCLEVFLPPNPRGYPVLGNSIQLGLQGLLFLQSCRVKHGDCYMLNLVGQRMAFFFAPQSISFFFKASNLELSFAPAVEQFTWRVFGLPPKDFLPRHHMLLDSIRAQVGTPGCMEGHARRLIPLIIREVQNLGCNANRSHNLILDKEKQTSSFGTGGSLVIDLFESVKRVVFSAGVESLFGSLFVLRHGIENLQKQFFYLDDGFELAASPMPQFLQPKFVRARNYLTQALSKSYEEGDFTGSIVGSLIESIDLPQACIGPMLLAVLWASQANTVPATFWAIAFLLLPENQHHKTEALQFTKADVGLYGKYSKRITEDRVGNVVQSNVDKLSPDMIDCLIETACNAFSPLRRSCEEALRLRSPSIDVRVAAKDLCIPCGDFIFSQNSISNDSCLSNHEPDKNAFIKSGTVVAICPWAVNLDPRLYNNPTEYMPGRYGMGESQQATAAHQFSDNKIKSCESQSEENLSSHRNVREVDPSLMKPCKKHVAGVGVGGIAGVAFGGGRYRCPGRYFAEMEIALIVGTILLSWDMELEKALKKSTFAGKDSYCHFIKYPGDGNGFLPPPNMNKLIGVKVPAEKCWVLAKPKL